MRARPRADKAGPVRACGVITVEAALRLDARPIVVIVLPQWRKIPGLLDERDSDGHHVTAKGHAIIASDLLPQVMEILGGKRARPR